LFSLMYACAPTAARSRSANARVTFLPFYAPSQVHLWKGVPRWAPFGRPSAPRDPLPLHFPRPPDRRPRCSEGGGGLRCMWRGSIAVGRNNHILDSLRPSQLWAGFLRVLAACGAKDMDCDVRSHSCAVSERCLEPEGAPLSFVPLLCRHHA